MPQWAYPHILMTECRRQLEMPMLIALTVIHDQHKRLNRSDARAHGALILQRHCEQVDEFCPAAQFTTGEKIVNEKKVLDTYHVSYSSTNP